jgi:hypothetical protein
MWQYLLLLPHMKDHLVQLSEKVCSVLNQLCDDPQTVVSERLHQRIVSLIQQARHCLEIGTGESLVPNDTIESLLDYYGMAEMTLNDVKSMAARYSYTMQDCQIRAILHVIGHSASVIEPPQGWVVVPERLSKNMKEAMEQTCNKTLDFNTMYNAMLNARPNLGKLIDYQTAHQMAMNAGGSTDYDGSSTTYLFSEQELKDFVRLIAATDAIKKDEE